MARPLIIGVGGAHSGAGKTAYVSLLLRRLKGWGAIKCTKTALYASLTDERETLLTEGKDTRRMLDSGAERVLWVQSPPSELKEVLPLAVEQLSRLKGIVVEGNSAIEFLGPDILIFIFGSDSTRLKADAAGILRKSDIVIAETSTGLPEKARRFGRSISDTEAFLTYVTEMVEKKEQIRSSLKERAASGKIPCSGAREIAEELGVPYGEVGKAADELDIKIAVCELGCF